MGIGDHAGDGHGTRPVLERADDGTVGPLVADEVGDAVRAVARQVQVEPGRPLAAREAVDLVPAAWLELFELHLLAGQEIVAAHLEQERPAAGAGVGRLAVGVRLPEFLTALALNTRRRRTEARHWAAVHHCVGSRVGFSLSGVARRAHSDWRARAQQRLRVPSLPALLDDVSQLVGEQPGSARGARQVLAGREHDVVPNSERVRADCGGRPGREGAGVQAYIAEIVAERPAHLARDLPAQRLPGVTPQHVRGPRRDQRGHRSRCAGWPGPGKQHVARIILGSAVAGAAAAPLQPHCPRGNGGHGNRARPDRGGGGSAADLRRREPRRRITRPLGVG